MTNKKLFTNLLKTLEFSCLSKFSLTAAGAESVFTHYI